VRYWRSSIAVFCVALLASLCVHLPIYEALGVLAEVMLNQPAPERAEPVEFELAPLGEAPEEPEPEPTARINPERPQPPPTPEPPRSEPPPRQARRPEPKAVPEPQVVVQKPAEPEPPKPEEQPEKLAITQKSDDPDVEPPPDARFIADEARRVEEETVARLRNMHQDANEPDPGRPSKSEEEAPGNDAEETEVADLREVQGSDERVPQEIEAEHRPRLPSEQTGGRREDPAVTRAPASSAASQQQDATRASGAESGGEEEVIVVDDGSGSFTIRRAPPGRGPGEAGGELQPGAPSPHRNDRRGAEARPGVNLRLSWSQFESTFGAEDLRAQRQAYLEQRRSRRRGSNRTRQWKKFRAAIENFVPNVRPGNQTALNAAASPFAHYLATVHRRIHREFAHKFLRGLPIAGGPEADRTLHTKLEIVINGDGSLHKVGVAKTSGYLPFDFGAFNSVTRAAPFPAPPRKILSGDGRVYVHWGFYRNERQCGTFNARPFILPNPPGTPKPGNGPLQDPGLNPMPGLQRQGRRDGGGSGKEGGLHAHAHGLRRE
jgi:hypothetical protein